MTTAASATEGIADADPLTAVLLAARRHQAPAQAAEAALLVTAVEWAILHPAESLASAATYGCGRNGTDQHLAGDGAPLIDQWCPAELAGVLHLSTEAGQRLIGEAVELKYRLPRLWWLVQAGELAAWQARRVAAHTRSLSADAAAFVDRNTVIRAGRVGPVVLDRLIAEAIARYLPAAAAQLQAEQAERRCFEISHQPGADGLAGQSIVYGILDLPDALDLDAAISESAQLLKNVGDAASLDVRRARAAGDLARRQPCLDLNDFVDDTAPEPPPDDDPDQHSGPDHVLHDTGRPVPERLSRQVAPRQVVLYLHLSDRAVTGGPTAATIGRVQNTQLPVLAQQIRDWIGQPDTQIVVKPVIDLNDVVAVDAYEIPDRIRERVLLRHPTCVFPWCHQPSFRTDLDHRIRYDAAGPPGQTNTDNLAPLPTPVSTTSSAQDLCALAIPPRRPTGRLRVDQPPRTQLAARPHRHHRDRRR